VLKEAPPVEGNFSGCNQISERNKESRIFEATKIPSVAPASHGLFSHPNRDSPYGPNRAQFEHQEIAGCLCRAPI
jgi:hypothetical protein